MFPDQEDGDSNSNNNDDFIIWIIVVIGLMILVILLLCTICYCCCYKWYTIVHSKSRDDCVKERKSGSKETRSHEEPTNQNDKKQQNKQKKDEQQRKSKKKTKEENLLELKEKRDNLLKEKNELQREFERIYPSFDELRKDRVLLLEQYEGEPTIDLKETHKVLVEELSNYFKDHLQYLLHIKVTGDSQKDKPEGQRNSTTESDEGKGEQEEVLVDEENPEEKPNDQQNEDSTTHSSEDIQTSQDNLLMQIDDHPLEPPLPAVQDKSLPVDNEGSSSKEQYKVYGLVLSASIKSWKVDDGPSRKDEVMQKVSSKYPFITGHTEVDARIDKALSMTWSMLTLLPPLLVTKPQCEYSEDILDTNRHTWDEDKSGSQQLYYYRPVLVYGNHLHVAVKGLVGNKVPE